MDTIQVHQTKDYGLFKTVDGNRQLNELHKKRLMQSMSQQYLVSPIIVNEHHQIIDGQHRFNAAKELNLPIYYIMIDGYGLSEVQRLNQNSKNWTSVDFMDGYADLGIKSYIDFKKLHDDHGLPFTTTLAIATGLPVSTRDSNLKSLKSFQAGTFEFDDVFGAEDRMAKIKALKQYTELWSHRTFILAMLQLLRNPNFGYSIFLHKLSYQQGALVPCTTTTQYISLIEEIYNYKNRNKVSLRY